jgi:hypothetical protein
MTAAPRQFLAPTSEVLGAGFHGLLARGWAFPWRTVAGSASGGGGPQVGDPVDCEIGKVLLMVKAGFQL